MKKNKVNLSSLGVESVEMENTVFPEEMVKRGYKRWDDGVITLGAKVIGGVTRSESGWFPKSTIYMSPFNTEKNFIIALDHEFIHSWQWAKFGNRMSKDDWDNFKEASAYSYTNKYFPYFQIQMQYNGIYNLNNWPTNLIPVP